VVAVYADGSVIEMATIGREGCTGVKAVFGAKQSGMNGLKLGRIPRDEDVVIEARRAAEEILDADPELAAHAQLREEVEDLLGDAVEFLFKS